MYAAAGKKNKKKKNAQTQRAYDKITPYRDTTAEIQAISVMLQ